MLTEKSSSHSVKTIEFKNQLDEIHKNFFENFNPLLKNNQRILSLKDAILLPRIKEYGIASEELAKVLRKADTLEKARALLQEKLHAYSGFMDSANFGIVALGVTSLAALFTGAFIPAGVGTLLTVSFTLYKRKSKNDVRRKQMAISVIDTVLKKFH